MQIEPDDFGPIFVTPNQIESWLLSSHEHRASMVAEMLPRAVHLLNTIGAWVKQARVAAYQQYASAKTRICEQDA